MQRRYNRDRILATEGSPNLNMAGVPKFTPHPKSAPGVFYVVKGECLACGYPHVIAPALVGWTGDKTPHCYWKKQPETSAELERAIGVLDAQELECHRYAGTDPAILERVSSAYCDHPKQLPSVVHPIDPSPPRFALLDDRPGPIIRAWRIITGHTG